MHAHVPSFVTITARQIDYWATGNNDARDQLPGLLRSLILSTADDVSRIDFPGYDNAQRTGWDGWLESGTATPWISDGRSGWEFSTNRRPRTKADADYRTRPAHRPRRGSSGMHLCVRHSAQLGRVRTTGSRRRKRFGHWKSVRALDASDLEQWLAESVYGAGLAG